MMTQLNLWASSARLKPGMSSAFALLNVKSEGAVARRTRPPRQGRQSCEQGKADWGRLAVCALSRLLPTL